MERQQGSRFALASLFAALLWPILILGYPLLFWDLVEYIAVGSGLGFGTMRPPNYAYFIRLLHWDTTLWPIILGQAALAAWLIWRTMDAMQLSARGRLGAAAIIAATSLPFFVIWIMADVLGGLLVLGAFVAVARPPHEHRSSACCWLASCWAPDRRTSPTCPYCSALASSCSLPASCGATWACHGPPPSASSPPRS